MEIAKIKMEKIEKNTKKICDNGDPAIKGPTRTCYTPVQLLLWTLLQTFPSKKCTPSDPKCNVLWVEVGYLSSCWKKNPAMVHTLGTGA